MSTDLEDLFATAGRNAPLTTVIADDVIRRGRRVRARRRAVVGTSSLLGVGVVTVGTLGLATGLPSGGHSAPATVGAAASTGVTPKPSLVGPSGSLIPYHVTTGGTPVPTGSPTSSKVSRDPLSPVPTPPPVSTPTPTGTPDPMPSAPAWMATVALPDPAPGFPVRRWSDSNDDDRPTGIGDGVYWVKTFGLAKVAESETTSPDGTVSSGPNGPEITILVGPFPMPKVTATTVEGNLIVARPTVAGVKGYVTSYTEKGSPMRELYFSTGRFTVEVLGFGGVSTAELVTLGNALTGLQ